MPLPIFLNTIFLRLVFFKRSTHLVSPLCSLSELPLPKLQRDSLETIAFYERAGLGFEPEE